MAKIKITLVKSVIGYSEQQRKTVRSLGLTKTGRSVIQNDRNRRLSTQGR